MGVSRKLAGAGVVAGLSALALVASPALSSAQVTGTWTATVSGAQITTTLTGLKTTLPFNYCEGYVYRGDATAFDRANMVQEFLITGTDMVKDQVLAGVAGSGTSTDLATGEYWVVTKCKEIGDTGYQVVGTPRLVAVTDGSTAPESGSVEDIFSQFGS